jgi:phosphatidylglycerol---prolipoprotein diacylglyceryl transferase
VCVISFAGNPESSQPLTINEFPANRAIIARRGGRSVTFPVWIGAGTWRIHPHLLFELLGYAVSATWYWLDRDRRGDEVSTPHRWSLAAAAIGGAVIGSRVLFWLEDPRATLERLTDIQHLIGGQTIVGGLLGGWIAVEIQKRRLGIRQPTGDLLAVPIALGTALGRIGCFLSGLPDGTYGTVTTLPWGIDFGDGVLRHPVAIYETLFLLALVPLLVRLPRRTPRGDTFLILMGCYFLFRLLVDFLKPGVPLAAGLTAIQLAAILGAAWAAWMWIARRRLEPRPIGTSG